MGCMRVGQWKIIHTATWDKWGEAESELMDVIPVNGFCDAGVSLTSGHVRKQLPKHPSRRCNIHQPPACCHSRNQISGHVQLCGCHHSTRDIGSPCCCYGYYCHGHGYCYRYHAMMHLYYNIYYHNDNYKDAFSQTPL